MMCECMFLMLKAAIWAEKRLYFRSGILLPLLRRFWMHKGRKIQSELNRQHDTAIRYGYLRG